MLQKLYFLIIYLQVRWDNWSGSGDQEVLGVRMLGERDREASWGSQEWRQQDKSAQIHDPEVHDQFQQVWTPLWWSEPEWSVQRAVAQVWEDAGANEEDVDGGSWGSGRRDEDGSCSCWRSAELRWIYLFDATNTLNFTWNHR